jgi:hypothetical protein
MSDIQHTPGPWKVAERQNKMNEILRVSENHSPERAGVTIALFPEMDYCKPNRKPLVKRAVFL